MRGFGILVSFFFAVCRHGFPLLPRGALSTAVYFVTSLRATRLTQGVRRFDVSLLLVTHLDEGAKGYFTKDAGGTVMSTRATLMQMRELTVSLRRSAYIRMRASTCDSRSPAVLTKICGAVDLTRHRFVALAREKGRAVWFTDDAARSSAKNDRGDL